MSESISHRSNYLTMIIKQFMFRNAFNDYGIMRYKFLIKIKNWTFMSVLVRSTAGNASSLLVSCFSRPWRYAHVPLFKLIVI